MISTDWGFGVNARCRAEQKSRAEQSKRGGGGQSIHKPLEEFFWGVCGRGGEGGGRLGWGESLRVLIEFFFFFLVFEKTPRNLAYLRDCTCQILEKTPPLSHPLHHSPLHPPTLRFRERFRE